MVVGGVCCLHVPGGNMQTRNGCCSRELEGSWAKRCNVVWLVPRVGRVGSWNSAGSKAEKKQP